MVGGDIFIFVRIFIYIRVVGEFFLVIELVNNFFYVCYVLRLGI